MDCVTYKMVGFDGHNRYRDQDDWQDVVYAGDDGSILVLLGAPYRAQNARQDTSFQQWDFAGAAEAGDWFRLRQRKEPISGRWYVLVGEKGNKRRKRPTHKLVLYAWYGAPDNERRLGLHGDDDSSNNAKDNLRWGTAKENLDDRYKNQRRAAEQMSGVRLQLEYGEGGWRIQVSRNAEPHEISAAAGIASRRRSDPKRLLCEAIDDLLGRSAALTPEKRPKRFEGHRPWSGCNFWFPVIADIPDDLDGHRENRFLEMTIDGKKGQVYEFITIDRHLLH